MARSEHCKIKIGLGIQASQRLKRLGRETEGVVMEGVRTCAKRWVLKSTIHIYIVCKYMCTGRGTEAVQIPTAGNKANSTTIRRRLPHLAGLWLSQQEVLPPNRKS